MFKKKNMALSPPEQSKADRSTPAFLRDDYPYKAVGEDINTEDLDGLDLGVVYEIKCPACEMSIRSQGVNIKSTFERLQSTGCIGCGSKNFVIRAVDMSVVAST